MIDDRPDEELTEAEMKKRLANRKSMERWHAMSAEKREAKLQKMRDYNKRCREARERENQGEVPIKRPVKPQKFEKAPPEKPSVTSEPPPEHDPDKPQQILDDEDLKKYRKITEFMRKRSNLTEEPDPPK